MDAIMKNGTYGLHVIKNPAGTFSFVGTVPVDLGNVIAKTYDAAIDDVITWILGLDIADQREMVGNLRNDIFAKFMEVNND